MIDSARMFADPATLTVAELLADARALFTACRSLDKWERVYGYVPSEVVPVPHMLPCDLHAFARIKLRQAREARQRERVT